MHEVWLKSMPQEALHTLERIIRKNNRSFTDSEVHALAKKAGHGQEILVRALRMDEAAHNLVVEISMHGGVAEIREGTPA